MAKFEKHPHAIAWDEWLESDEGSRMSSGTTSGQYLYNRLWWAFMAGIKHGRRMQAEEDRQEQVVQRFAATREGEQDAH